MASTPRLLSPVTSNACAPFSFLDHFWLNVGMLNHDHAGTANLPNGNGSG